MVSNAATPRSIRINPQVSFLGQTTKCRAVIMADSSTDKISFVVKLYKNGHCINMWSESGEGTLYFEEESTAFKGCSYRIKEKVSPMYNLPKTILIVKKLAK